MWAWLWKFLVWASISTGLSYAIGALTKRDAERPSTPEPDDFNIQTGRQGTKYTIVFGTCWVENPVVAWWGDSGPQPIIQYYTEKDMWGGSDKVAYVAGYNYSAGIEYIVTQGSADGILQIKVANKVAWPYADQKDQLASDGETLATINAPALFGGGTQGGGVIGDCAFAYGESDQLPDSYLVEQLGANISAGRGLTRAIFRKTNWGNSPYNAVCKFLVKRNLILTDGSSQWYPSKAAIHTFDLNPAHIIHEGLINTQWGMGIDSDLLPDDVWKAVADDLYDEGFGLSMKWEDQNQTLKQFINEVLRHIDAVLYQDPQTGEIILKLIRDDYNPATIESFDEDTIEAIDKYGSGTVYTSPNVVLMQYWNQIDNKPILIKDYNRATIYLQNNKIIPYEVRFNGITDDDLAQAVVSRERYKLSAFPFMMQISGKRNLAVLRPGDVIKIEYAPLEIELMYVRVLNVNLGTLNNGTVKLDCIQDIFSTQNAVFAPRPDTEWEDPRTAAQAVEESLIIEMPFQRVRRNLGFAITNMLDDDAGYLMIGAERPTASHINYECQMRVSASADFYPDGYGNFTPTGTLKDELPVNADDAVITIENGVDVDQVSLTSAWNWCVIGNEVCKIKSIDSDDSSGNPQFTIARGCLDTVPEYHAGNDDSAGGARVWFMSFVSYTVGRSWTDGDQPDAKLFPITSFGKLGSADVIDGGTLNSRQVRPYPPGNFKINGDSYPVSFSGQPTITWSHRNRESQYLTGITEHSATGITSEASVTYTLTIYDEDNNQCRQVTGLTGETYTYSQEDEMSDCGIQSGDPLNSQLRFVLKSVRESYDSWQEYDLTVQRV